MGFIIKFILRYRLISDLVENVIFKDLNVLGDRKYYIIIFYILDVMEDNGNKIFLVIFYVDCKLFGKVEIVLLIFLIFFYKGILFF